VKRHTTILKNSFLSLLSFTFILLGGCGGMSTMVGNPAETSNLRVVDGNGMMPSVNVVIDGSSVRNNVTFLTQTGYFAVPAGNHQLTLDGWLDPPNVSAPENFPAQAKMTLVFEGCGIFGRSGFALVTDDLTPPAAGNFKLRIVDGAINGFGDLYILPAGAAPSGTPTVAGITMTTNSPTPYFSLPAGTYHVVLTQAGNTTEQFESGPISFSAGQNRTLYLFQDGGQTSTPGVFFCSNIFKSMLVSDLN
jgi:uncharacterized protein DUF4397